MVCNILDLRCVLMNELIGSVVLAVIIGAILFLTFASRINLGFKATVVLAVPFLLILAIGFGGLTSIMAFLTLIIAIAVAVIFNKILGNR